MESCDKEIECPQGHIHCSNSKNGVCDQFLFVTVNITELGVESTIEQLLHMDPPFHVNLHLSSLLDGKMDGHYYIFLTVHSTTCQGQYFLWTAVPLLDVFQWFTDVVPAANAGFVQNIEREQMVT
ncbi:hypothetical protein EMCRGX_G030299 [Ephydatia muelleri]